MKVSVESLSSIRKKLSISLPEEAVLRQFDEAYERLRRSAEVPGFRKGKVPRPMLEKRFGASVEAQVYEDLVRDSMFKALKDEDLNAVAIPEIEEPKREKGTGFSYVASVEVKPKFEPKNFKEIKVVKPATDVKDEQVAEVLTKLQDAQSVLKEREGATKPVKGDFVGLIIRGIDEAGNLTAPDAETKEQIYEIGGGILHPDLEKAVLKMSLNDAAPVTVQGKISKADDPSQIEEKEIHVQVTLKAIKEKILPALTDDFAKSVGPFENLEALKKRIREDLAKEAGDNAKGEMAKQILDSLVKDNPLELPPSLVDHEVHQIIRGFWQQLERAGMREIPEEYSEEKLHEKVLPDAQRRVHEQLLIEAVAAKENISVEEAGVTKKITELAGIAKVPAAEFRAFYEKTNRIEALRFNLLAQKTLDFLLSTANIK
jgi:trigger factor